MNGEPDRWMWATAVVVPVVAALGLAVWTSLGWAMGLAFTGGAALGLGLVYAFRALLVFLERKEVRDE